MLNIFKGIRPDITPAQVVGLLVAGLPICGTLGRAFGIFDMSPDQEAALSDALQWGGVVAGTLFISDAGLRAARGRADADVQAAAFFASNQTSPPGRDPEVDTVPDQDLPRDDEEFSSGIGQAPPQGEFPPLGR